MYSSGCMYKILNVLQNRQYFSCVHFRNISALSSLQVVGVDYCSEAIQLSQRVAQQAGLEITFETCNILEGVLQDSGVRLPGPQGHLRCGRGQGHL